MAFGVVFLILVLGYVLGPRRKTSKKGESFECGIPSEGEPRVPFRVKYFLVAILFVLFDVEIVFMYPWAVNFKRLTEELGVIAFVEMFLFAMTIFVGLAYVVRQGALKWEK